MTRTSSRSGSALLIVLGMLSFMIISAVGFAAYMRFSRQPSSFLRRSSSTRQLIKAALAEAINEIDLAIGNNPHPGIGRNRAAGTSLENIWQHRVFIGTNVTINVTGSGNASSDIGNASPLCLEALAYIPPPLVNEARFYSHYTPTARWRPLDFDSGRYSWMAIDVSDYFDVNRLLADAPRSSAAGRRVTLAHLFEGTDHTSAPSGASQWDKFMERFRGQQDEETLSFDLKGREPLISIADFNLALGANGKIGDMRSPFYTYLTESSNNGFYNISSEKEKEAIRQMTFVTDSLQKPAGDLRTDEGEKIYDLSDGKNQPFTTSFLESTTPPLSEAMLRITQSPSDSWMKWQDRLSGLGRAALYDYLDPDHVPISLAIPTTERVPMICGISPDLINAKFAVAKTYSKAAGGEEVSDPFPHGDQDPSAKADNGATRTCKQSVYYRISADFARTFQASEVSALVCFPFTRPDPTDGSFSVDGRLSVFLTSGDVSLRTGSATDAYGLKKNQIDDQPLDAATGVFSVKLPAQNVNFKGTTISKQADAVKRVVFNMPNAQGQIGSALQQKGNEFLRIDYVWTQTYTKDKYSETGTWGPEWKDATAANGGKKIDRAHCGIPATQWNNRREYQGVDDAMANDGNLAEFLRHGGSRHLTLRTAVWLRVKDDKGKIVDFVPACFNDDKIQNNMSDPYPLMNIHANSMLGAPNPLMLFKTGVDFDFSEAGLDALVSAPKDFTLEPKRVMVSDPRYNHAPEHWFAVTAEMTPESWINENQIGTSSTGRDNDIFMATSDAGYLQSRYEIAFLPRFSNLRNGGSETGSYRRPDDPLLSEIPDSFGKTHNQDMVWRTFDPFHDNTDAFYDLPWRNLGTGQTVNPYSDSTNVLMAAFANTPIDWKRASTNVIDGAEDFATMKVSDFNKKYALNEYAPKGQRLAWMDLEEIAGRFMDEMHNGKETNWENVWDDLPWSMDGTQSKRIFGFDMDSVSDDLWTVDRKFLYGFWRDCFAARQQLFLVFVRAEPMMMGSDGNGRVPPQLGARAMAVVWRDPTESKNDRTPHQTRVLFYRQFE